MKQKVHILKEDDLKIEWWFKGFFTAVIIIGITLLIRLIVLILK